MPAFLLFACRFAFLSGLFPIAPILAVGAEPDHICEVGEFLCHDRVTCVSQNWLCDGDPDCPDESDEASCPEKIEFKCPLNHIKCIGSNRCIHMSQLCNGVYDCPDEYDEGVHCRELLPKCEQMQCQYKCAMSMNETRCYCEEGYEVGRDGKTCQDFNECNLYGLCSQICQNTDGSYICSCVEGYLLQPNKKSCKVKKEPNDLPPLLLIANSDTIDVLYVNGTRTSIFGFLRGSGIQTLDYIHHKNTICWMESRDSSTQLKCLEASKTGKLTDEWIISTIPNLHNIRHMAVDWLTGNFYFVDQISDTIFVCNFNGTVCVTLIDLDLHNPMAVAVDPTLGKKKNLNRINPAS